MKEKEIVRIGKIIEHGQNIYHQGRTLLFHIARIAGPAFSIVGLLLLFSSLIESSEAIGAVKLIFVGIIFQIIAHLLKDGKNRNT